MTTLTSVKSAPLETGASQLTTTSSKKLLVDTDCGVLGTYASINEYLKALDLGRVKAGFNSQTDNSFGLWNNAVKKGNAVGFYRTPDLVHGVMKSALPYIGTGALGAAALDQVSESSDIPQDTL